MYFSKILVVLILLVEVRVSKGQRCLNKETDLNKDAASYEYVRYGHYVELECCSRAGGTVSWMKWVKGTNNWQKYLPDRSDVLLLESNQILAIQSAVFEDSGSYKCQEQNGSNKTDLKKIKLKVIACDKLARGPYPVSPLPCPETVVTERETITLPCMGYFGCGEQGDVRIVMWYVSEDTKDEWKEVSETDERYIEKNFEEESGTIVGSNLTIKDASHIDFNRKFMCLLASPQKIKGQSNIFVKLRNKNKTGEGALFKSGFSSGEAFVILTVVAVVLLIVTAVFIGLCVHKQLFEKRKARKRNIDHQWKTIVYKGCEDSGQMLP